MNVDKKEYTRLVGIKNRLEKDLVKTRKTLYLIDDEMDKFSANGEIIDDNTLNKALEAELRYERIAKYLGIKSERCNHEQV